MGITVRKNYSDVVWSDLDASLISDAQGDIKIVNNIDSITTSLDNILGTFTGERVMLPSFASSFKHLLFDPTNKDLLDSLALEIKQTIERWDNRVSVVSSDIYSDPDRNQTTVKLVFAVKNFQGTFTYDKIFSV